MTITEAQIRAASQGIVEDRAFVYFHHTPKGFSLFVSRDLIGKGQRGNVMRVEDPGYYKGRRFMDVLLMLAKQNGYGGRGGLRPVASAMEPFVARAAKAVGIEASFLAGNGAFNSRILLKI